MCSAYSTSGRPVAIEVNTDRIPLNAEADRTRVQSTSDNATALVEIMAIAV